MRTRLVAAPFLFLLACTTEPAAPTPPPAPPPTPPAAKTAKIGLTGGSIGIIARKNGDTDVPARFQTVSGELELDPADLSSVHGTIQIDLASWASDEDVRDQRMRDTFFDTANNPSVSFDLSSVDGTSGPLAAVGATATGNAHGTLRWRALSQELTVPVTVLRNGQDAWKVTTAAPFDLSIAGLGMQAPLDALITLCQHKSIDDTVKVSLDLQVGTAPAPATAPAATEEGGPRPLVKPEPRLLNTGEPRAIERPTAPATPGGSRPLSKPEGK